MSRKVFIALSGGVDSSTSAAILLEQGYDVSGVFMITCDESHHGQADAQNVADKLSIDLHVIDMRKQFADVLEYFRNEYEHARTPNPCVYCNRMIKFGKLWQYAKRNGADYFATGHYAVVKNENKDHALLAADTAKDQSYVLSMINRDILGHLILPLGEFDKDHTRKLAAKYELEDIHGSESQEICFIPNDDYVSVLEEMSPELCQSGDIIDIDGNVLGKHEGIHRYTIGQRRGLKVAMGIPYYVVRLDPESNTVVLGPTEQLMSRKLLASGDNWLMAKPTEPFQATVKIRYNHRGVPAIVRPTSNGVEIEFQDYISAVTPGQLAVFYIDQDGSKRVAGGAWIDKVSG